MEILTFFIEIFIALLLSVSAVVSLKRPLAHLLSELCGTTQRAEFWARYTNIMLFITPLLGVIMFGRNMPSPEINFIFLKESFRSALFGLFIALVIIGFQLVRFTQEKVELEDFNTEKPNTPNKPTP
jgi:hypothetical protein